MASNPGPAFSLEQPDPARDAGDREEHHEDADRDAGQPEDRRACGGMFVVGRADELASTFIKSGAKNASARNAAPKTRNRAAMTLTCVAIRRPASYWSPSSSARIAGSSKSVNVTFSSLGSSYSPPSRPVKRSLIGPFGPRSLFSQRFSLDALFFFGGPKFLRAGRTRSARRGPAKAPLAGGRQSRHRAVDRRSRRQDEAGHH